MIRDRCPMCGQVVRARKGPPRNVVTEEIGRRLRSARFGVGLTLAQVAAQLDPPVSQAALSQWETGDRSLTVERVAQMARVYGRDAAEFVRDLTSADNHP